jgi:predicted kinase
MAAEGPALIVVGGFAGAGKSTVSARLAAELGAPLLSSDSIGAVIAERLGASAARSDAFAAGYDVIFDLAGRFLASRCTVVIDTNMGWAFQWRELDAILARAPAGTLFVPMILRCPYDVCAERMRQRYAVHPVGRRTPDEVLASPAVQGVWAYLDGLDRPDVREIDATGDPDSVYAAVRATLRRLATFDGGGRRVDPDK